MYELKTNTAVRIPVGPLVDPTDGKTAETALTVIDLSVQLYQIKNDGSAVVRAQFAPTASGGNNDMALVSSSTDGMYDLELTAAQLNWLGCGRICFYDVDGFLVHWIDISIVSAAYFDWKYGSTIPDVNVSKIGGTTQTARDIGANVDVTVSSRSATGAKMDIVDAPNATAVAAIQNGLSKPGTAQTITANQSVNVAQWNGENVATPAISGEPVVTLAATQTAYSPAKAGDAMAVSDKTGFSLSTAGIKAIWDFLTADVTAAIASFANLFKTNIDAKISEAGGGGGLDAAGVRAAIGLATANLDEQLEEIILQITALGTGTGPVEKPYYVSSAGIPCGEVLVIMSLDNARAYPIHKGITDATGWVKFYPNVPTGTKVYMWSFKTGVDFTNPDEEEV